ncbi:MAG: HAMP domain-containing histidine kinase [Clostridia bacterium]|nr:HAMP domain-containing histidine kinase [Clostridia bacterium]
MLKKLKNKFILINMLTVGIVLLLIVLSMTIITYNREIKRTEDMVWNGKFDKFIKIDSSEEMIMDPVFLQHNYFKNTEIAFVDKQGNICETSRPEIFEKINSLKEQKGKSFGVIYAKHKVRETNFGDYEYCIVISQLSTINRQVQGIFFIGLSVVLSAMCIFYFISRKLADVVVKPAEEAWKNQKRFVADASHDLKTPLTVIMANNEIMLSHPDSTIDQMSKWLDSTKIEGEHMRELINQMLDLAKSEILSSTLKLQEANISELTEKIALQLEPIAYEKNVGIETEITENIFLESDSNEYMRLLRILVDNAIKYAPKDTKILIGLRAEKKSIVLYINNKGDVIPKEELKHIFERFYRSDSARTKGGFGLGLSIAKNIVTALNGEITASSNETDGTTFTVRLK